LQLRLGLDSSKDDLSTVPFILFFYPDDREVSIRQSTTIEGNTITIEILEIDDVSPGDLSINVDRGGNVYIV